MQDFTPGFRRVKFLVKLVKFRGDFVCLDKQLVVAFVCILKFFAELVLD